MDLSGTWRAAAGDEALRRRFADRDFDDGEWAELPVPGHWRSHPGFETSNGPVLHRRRFEAPAPEAGRRAFVVLEGCFYQSDVWLDGLYLGDTEGYFQPHAFEISQLLRAGGDHVLAVELSCGEEREKAAKRKLTGVFQHWSSIDPDWNPGGIWRPVRLVETGPVRIATLRVRCTEAGADRARLHLSAQLDAADATEIELCTTVRPAAAATPRSTADHIHRTLLTAGVNDVGWHVDVDSPALWWPRALSPDGRPPALVDVEVQARVPGGDGLSDATSRRTGLRQARMARWVLEVNGERLFVKGSSLGPSRMDLGAASVDELARDVDLAQEAGLDLLRVHAHISRPELYEAADGAGLLLWQDLPLQRGYDRTVRRHAVAQAAAAVDLLAHHPSIVLWCGHNEPVPPADGLLPYLRSHVLPTWSKAVLDPSLARVLETADGSRPVVPHSGVLPHPRGGTAAHTSFGWSHGEVRDMPRWLRRLPVLARFVGEFGAPAVPVTAEWMEPDRWPDLDWDRLSRTHGLQKAAFDRRVPPDRFESFAAWQAATQEHQASLLRHHVEALRRLKYRPTGGFCQFMLLDSHPAVSWSVLDHERVPKPGYHALSAACAPVIVTADRPDAIYCAGAAVALDVHVVSDLRTPLEGCVVRADLTWTTGSHRWGFVGDVGADDVVRVGTLSFVVPDAPGPLTLDLRLEGPVEASASYASEVVPAGSRRRRLRRQGSGVRLSQATAIRFDS